MFALIGSISLNVYVVESICVLSWLLYVPKHFARFDQRSKLALLFGQPVAFKSVIVRREFRLLRLIRDECLAWIYPAILVLTRQLALPWNLWNFPLFKRCLEQRLLRQRLIIDWVQLRLLHSFGELHRRKHLWQALLAENICVTGRQLRRQNLSAALNSEYRLVLALFASRLRRLLVHRRVSFI